jgi:enamine deaminase RidA (YjgF/YER057c/UK114 family)
VSAVRLGSGGPYEDRYGYSRVVAVGDHAWTAGCTSIVDGELVGVGDAYLQTVTALRTAVASLERVGFGRSDVVFTRMYVVDIATHSDAVGRAHGEVLGDVRPSAAMLGVAALVDPQMIVEVELVAAREGGQEHSAAREGGQEHSAAREGGQEHSASREGGQEHSAAPAGGHGQSAARSAR